MLHRLQTKMIDNGRLTLTAILDSHRGMVLTMQDKKTGARIQMDTTYSDWLDGNMKIHEMMSALDEEFGDAQ